MALGVLGDPFRRERFFQPGLLLVGTVMLAAAFAPRLAPNAPPPSWGAMVAGGRDLLRVAPWVS